MDDDGKNKTTGSLVKTVTRAKRVFELVFADNNQLQNNLFLLLKNIDNPVVSDLFEQFPKLLHQYDLKLLLSGKIEIAYTHTQEVQQACLLGVLQSLLLSVQQLLDTDSLDFTKDQIDIKMIHYIEASIPLSDLSLQLGQLVRFAVGGWYYDAFTKQFSTANHQEIHRDIAQHQSFELMLWWGTIRIFLDALEKLTNIR